MGVSERSYGRREDVDCQTESPSCDFFVLPDVQHLKVSDCLSAFDTSIFASAIS